MQRQESIKPCRICHEKIRYNAEINKWCNYEDGLIHVDNKRSTNQTIENIDFNYALQQIALLRKNVWEIGQAVFDIQRRLA